MAFILILTFQPVLFPFLADGHSTPKQEEYSAYESNVGSELVNPSTGDFSYSIPLLEIPSPEGGFSLPLTYKAGIKLEDEASWVGLGWSLNPGAIIRQVNGYPDDANGDESVFQTYNNDSNREWNAALPEVKSNNFKIETSFATKAEGALRQTGMSAINMVVSGFNPYMIAFFVVDFVLNLIFDDDDNNATQTPKPRYDFERKEKMYGPLYFGKEKQQLEGLSYSGQPYNEGLNFNSTSNSTTYKATVFKKIQNFTNNNSNPPKTRIEAHTSDVYRENINVAGNNGYVSSSEKPISIAYDNFTVMGPGISGTIKPYRLETGSVCVPNYDHYRNNMTGSWATHDKFNPVPFIGDYKVNFRYDGYLSNTYQHHDYYPNQMGASATTATSTITLSDPKLFTPLNRTENNRKGLIISPVTGGYNRSLVQGRHINWYTNQELSDPQNPVPGFIECDEALKGNTFGNQDSIMRANNSHKIGAFSITAEDGKTYHYSLPVYNYYSKSVRMYIDDQSYNFNELNSPFAEAWLLTAITGPDFTDDGTSIGKIDKNDTGYWVKFEYGRYNNIYTWRQPYFSQTISGDGKIGYPDPFNSSVLSYSIGHRETYYLNAIKTRSHTALFIKEDRMDAQGFNFAGARQTGGFSLAMKLSEIIILKNEDFEKLENGLDSSTPAFSTNTGNNDSTRLNTWVNPKEVYQGRDFTPNIRTFVESRMVKRIAFEYTNDLCVGSPSSDPYNPDGRGGKLTLIGIKSYNKNSSLPENDGFVFGYGYNPNYGRYKYDAFGYYKSTGHVNESYRRPVTDKEIFDMDGAAWSIKHIIDPKGVTTTIHYERDTYHSILDSNYLPVDRAGGDIRVKKIVVSEGNNSYSTRYFYSDDYASINPRSTGVIAREPYSYNNRNTPRYNSFDFPSTPILYSKVTVLNGPFANEINDFDEKIEYNFYTPAISMVSEESTTTTIGDLATTLISSTRNTITVNTGLIGQLKSILRYNKRNEVETKTTYNYLNTIPHNNNNDFAGQGLFTEGTISLERIGNSRFSFNRTVKKYLPNILASITSEQNTIESTSTNEVWDFFSGQVLESSSVNSLGIHYWEKKVPAYDIPGPVTGTKKYPEMGLKGESDLNKNMLIQEAANYVYKKPASGPWNPFDAQIQTWKKDWSSYRVFNSTTEKFEESNSGPQVWRPFQTFKWNSKELNPDGTIRTVNDFNDNNFNWNSNYNPNWILTSEITRYDKFSKVLEVRDINNTFNSVKFDQPWYLSITNALNAKYVEMAYSGAEDGKPVSSSRFTNIFGGEILSGGVIDTTNAHAGNISIKLSPGQTGFTYRAKIGTEIQAGRKYFISVWVKEPTNGALKASAKACSGTSCTEFASITSAHPNGIMAGDWKLVNLAFTINSGFIGQDLEVACENINPSNLIYIDDFKFQPIEAQLIGNNFDPITWLPTYQLNNDNFFSYIEYDLKNRPKVINREAEGAGKKKVKEYSYYNAPHKIYSNFAITGTFQMFCKLQQQEPTSAPITYTLPAGSVTSIYSQEDAQEKAIVLFNQEGQNLANSNGTCGCKPSGTILYYECETHHSGVCRTYAISVVNNPSTGTCSTVRNLVSESSTPCDPAMPCEPELE